MGSTSFNSISYSFILRIMDNTTILFENLFSNSNINGKCMIYSSLFTGWTFTVHLNRRTRLLAVFYLIKNIDVKIYKVIDVYVYLDVM